MLKYELLRRCLPVKTKNRAGERHFNIVIIGAASDRITRRLYWIYQCDCGTVERVETKALSKKKKCPKCAHLDQTAKVTKHGHAKEKQRSSLYNTWLSMKKRCSNPADSSYPHYGGRGIKVCDRWLNFENFYRDMHPKPSPSHQINRINNNGNYEPSNVNWVTPAENSNNRRSSVILSWQGKTLTLAEWAIEVNLPYSALKQRYKKGWSIEKMLTTPWLARNQRKSFFRI